MVWRCGGDEEKEAGLSVGCCTSHKGVYERGMRFIGVYIYVFA